MHVEIRPANLAQVVNFQGQLVHIDDDVTGVAKQLRDIDPQLKLFFADDGKDPYWVVRRDMPKLDGSVEEQLVLTSRDLDGRIVSRVEVIAAEGYDYVAELDRVDSKAKADEEHRYAEQRGPIVEELSHAIRKDLGIKRNF